MDDKYTLDGNCILHKFNPQSFKFKEKYVVLHYLETDNLNELDEYYEPDIYDNLKEVSAYLKTSLALENLNAGNIIVIRKLNIMEEYDV